MAAQIKNKKIRANLLLVTLPTRYTLGARDNGAANRLKGERTRKKGGKMERNGENITKPREGAS